MNRFFNNLISVIAFLSFLESQSQNFVNPGAEWKFRNIVDGASYTTFTNWKYQNDTIIQGLTYQIIKLKVKNLYYFPLHVYEYNATSFLLRSSGDSLFCSRIELFDEHLLYDFSPIIGNTWDVFPFLIGYTTPPTTPQFVQTIGFGDTIINGNTVNWIEIMSLNPDSLYFEGRIYNHFGKQYFFPLWNDSTIDVQGIHLECYNDDILGEISFSTCQDYETLGMEIINEFDFKLIADSKYNRLIIEKIDSFVINSLVIYDLIGRQVFTKKQFNNNQVELSLPSGIYICNITIGNMNYNQKFLW